MNYLPRWMTLLMLASMAASSPFLAAQASGATTVFCADFNSPGALKAWQDSASGRLVTGYQGTPSLLIEQTAKNGSAKVQTPLPAAPLAGQLVALRAVVRADAVTTPPKEWNGIKVMMVLETKDGKKHPQIELPSGTFDWTTATQLIRAPKDLTSATLVLGLEQVAGRVWFDDVEVRAGKPERTGKRNETMFKGHALARLRGVMHGPKFDDENLRVLAREWGANQVRWQLNWTPMKEAEEWARDLDAYDKWLDGALADTDKALDACEKHSLKVLLDLHCPPGGRAERGVCRLFREQRYQDKLIEVWDRIARRYKGRDIIYAYDLLNEPVEGIVAPGLLSWRDLATKAARTIRAVDPGKPVVFEPGPWGACDGFETLSPLDLDRVIYSFHMYKPHAFTHQGVRDTPLGAAYPGLIGGETWNKERLREEMRPAIEFQRDFNVQIYVGEFSAARWAPGDSAHQYLRDLIDLFEECGWDWSYHAYREADVWSVEHGPDPKDKKPSTAPTERKKLLLRWFARNERPEN